MKTKLWAINTKGEGGLNPTPEVVIGLDDNDNSAISIDGKELTAEKIEQIGQGGGEPETYLKNAEVSEDGKTLTLIKKDDTTVEFQGGGDPIPTGAKKIPCGVCNEIKTNNPVPNQGYVYKISFNTNATIDEVNNILSQLTFHEVPGYNNPQYAVVASNDLSQGIAITKFGDNDFMISDIENTYVYFSSIDRLPSVSAGWSDTGFWFNANSVSTVMGLPIGNENNLITDIIYYGTTIEDDLSSLHLEWLDLNDDKMFDAVIFHDSLTDKAEYIKGNYKRVYDKLQLYKCARVKFYDGNVQNSIYSNFVIYDSFNVEDEIISCESVNAFNKIELKEGDGIQIIVEPVY